MQEKYNLLMKISNPFHIRKMLRSILYEMPKKGKAIPATAGGNGECRVCFAGFSVIF